MSAAWRPIRLWRGDVEMECRADGSFILRATDPLGAYPPFITDRLEHWAAVSPDAVFLTQRTSAGPRRHLTYGAALQSVRSIGQALVARGLNARRPVAILSENSIEFALLTLACLYAGIPVAPISPAYALISQDFERLRQVIDSVRPGLVFAAHPGFGPGITATLHDASEVVLAEGALTQRDSTPFSALVSATPGRGPGARAGRAPAGRYRKAAVHLRIDRHAQRRHQHTSHAVREPADDYAGSGISAGGKTRSGRLATLASYFWRQQEFWHCPLQRWYPAYRRGPPDPGRFRPHHRQPAGARADDLFHCAAWFRDAARRTRPEPCARRNILLPRPPALLCGCRAIAASLAGPHGSIGAMLRRAHPDGHRARLDRNRSFRRECGARRRQARRNRCAHARP